MATVTVEGSKVFFDNVVINNEKIARAINEIKADERVKFVERAIEQHLFATDIAGDRAKIDSLGKTVKLHTADMEMSIEKAKNMIVQSIIDGETAVKGNLDVSTEAIKNLIDKVESNIIKEREMERIKSKTGLAGLSYQENVGCLIREIASFEVVPFEDVSRKTGKIDTKGDFIIDFKEGRVVFEVKKGAEPNQKGNQKKITFKEATNEISGAVKNHDAEFGVFIAKDITTLPKEIDTIGILRGPYIAYGMENNGVPLPEILKVVCQIARIKMAAKKTAPMEVNIVKIEELCTTAQYDIIKAFKKCKDIENDTKELETSLLKNIEQTLDDILKIVK